MSRFFMRHSEQREGTSEHWEISRDAGHDISERGFALILTLILILMLSLLASSEMSMNTTQTRIASNASDQLIAFQTAEGALNDTINNLIAGQYTNESFLANANGYYLVNANNSPLWTTIDWTSNTAVIKGFQGDSYAQSTFFIEQLPSVIRPGQSFNLSTQMYRLTVRAVGASGNSPVLIQSTAQIQR